MLKHNIHKKKNHKFYDKKAIEVISKIKYDFTAANKDRKMKFGVISRTIVLDEMVSDYIKKHPHCTIINIASGMDTRFDRLDNGQIRWYNVDLENSANFRLKYIEDTDRVKTLSYSAMDEKWVDEIKIESGNVLIIIEGLTMYLQENDVSDILKIINANLIFFYCMPCSVQADRSFIFWTNAVFPIVARKKVSSRVAYKRDI